MGRLAWAALAVLALVVFTAGCLQLGDASPEPGATDPPEGAASEPSSGDKPSIVPGSAELGLAWTRERWGADDRVQLVDETRTKRAPVDATLAGHESTWLGSAEVFRPEAGRFVPPGTTSVNVTVDWTTRPAAWSLEADLLVGTADEAPSWLNDDHARIPDLRPGDTVSLPVSPRDWDAPMQESSLWWFGVDLDGERASVPVEVDLHLEAVAHRAGEIPTKLVAYDPWRGEDRIELLDGSERANDILMDGPRSGRYYHCPERCDGLVWSPPGGPLVPEEADTVRATIRWEGDLPSRPVLSWVVEPGESGPMHLVDEGERYRTFETDVPDELADSVWQNRTAWNFEADLETARQDPDVYSGSMTLSAEAIRDTPDEQGASLPASPARGGLDGGKLAGLAGWSAGLVALGVALWLLSKLRWGGLGALYSRIPDDEVLENERRRRIAEIVGEEPGIHFRELRRRLDTGGGVLEHHLRKLADADVLAVETTGSHRCFFRKGRLDPDQRRALASLKSSGARRVAEAIERRPAASLSEIADAVDLAVSTVSHHVERLEARGVVTAERAGNAKRLRLTPLGDGVLDRL